jgi:hypothetical protein
MQQSLIVHLLDDDPLVCEVDELPDPTHQFMIIHTPRYRDGRTLPDLGENVSTLLIPWRRIAYVQLLPVTDVENIVSFVRE